MIFKFSSMFATNLAIPFTCIITGFLTTKSQTEALKSQGCLNDQPSIAWFTSTRGVYQSKLEN